MPVGVRRLECRGHVPGDAQALARMQSLLTPQTIPQGLAEQVLHHDIGRAVRPLTRIEDPDYRRMEQAFRDADLLQQPIRGLPSRAVSSTLTATGSLVSMSSARYTRAIAPLPMIPRTM